MELLPVFSDESRFCISSNDGRVRVWREPDTSYDPRNLIYTQRNAVSIMVWGCVGIYGVGDLVVVYGNMDNAKISGDSGLSRVSINW